MAAGDDNHVTRKLILVGCRVPGVNCFCVVGAERRQCTLIFVLRTRLRDWMIRLQDEDGDTAYVFSFSALKHIRNA